MRAMLSTRAFMTCEAVCPSPATPFNAGVDVRQPCRISAGNCDFLKQTSLTHAQEISMRLPTGLKRLAISMAFAPLAMLGIAKQADAGVIFTHGTACQTSGGNVRGLTTLD
jgi:hypothetical protein